MHWTPWTYRARVDRVVDGDTYDLIIDLGFGLQKKQRVRLLGVDTAETYGVPHDSEEYERGEEQAVFVRQWFAKSDSTWPLKIWTKRTGKYGRYLVRIEREDGEKLAQTLKAEFEDV